MAGSGAFIPGLPCCFSQAVGEFVIASRAEWVPSEARRRVRAGLYAGYGHGRTCLGAAGAPANVFLRLSEDVASCLEGVAVRLDPFLLRALLESEAGSSITESRSAALTGPAETASVDRAFDYGLAVAVVECDMLGLP